MKKFLTYTVMSGTLSHINIRIIRENPDRITESAKPGTKSVCVARLPVISEPTVPKMMHVSTLHFFYSNRNK